MKNSRSRFVFLAPQVNQVKSLSDQLKENDVSPSDKRILICSFTYNWVDSSYLNSLDNYYVVSPEFQIAGTKSPVYDDFKSQFNTKPTFDVMFAYDNLHILAKLLMASRSTEEFSTLFNSQGKYEGASGPITFPGHNDSDVSIVMTKIGGGQQILVKP